MSKIPQFNYFNTLDMYQLGPFESSASKFLFCGVFKPVSDQRVRERVKIRKRKKENNIERREERRRKKKKKKKEG